MQDDYKGSPELAVLAHMPTQALIDAAGAIELRAPYDTATHQRQITMLPQADQIAYNHFKAELKRRGL